MKVRSMGKWHCGTCNALTEHAAKQGTHGEAKVLVCVICGFERTPLHVQRVLAERKRQNKHRACVKHAVAMYVKEAELFWVNWAMQGLYPKRRKVKRRHAWLQLRRSSWAD